MRYFIWLIGLFFVVMASCSDEPVTTDPDSTPTLTDTTSVEGYNILAKLPGIWNGPVTSSTPLGSYPEWIVDFRPISAAQVSAKNELDSINDIFMSFFIVLHNGSYKMAFRNGGGFAGLQRNSYMVIDSVVENSTHSFYRFVDFVAKEKRVYTDVTFKADSLIIHSYTNKFNTLATATTHMQWRAHLKDTTSTQAAIDTFGFPKKELVKDFSTTFAGLTETVFYQPSADPYPESEQPYLGEVTVSLQIAQPSTVDVNKKILVIITTKPLFDGFVFKPNRLDFRSRYVFVNAAASTSFTFNYFHPGTYYVNAIYDSNGDLDFSTGDFINMPFDATFSLSREGSVSVPVTINFQIP